MAAAAVVHEPGAPRVEPKTPSVPHVFMYNPEVGDVTKVEFQSHDVNKNGKKKEYWWTVIYNTYKQLTKQLKNPAYYHSVDWELFKKAYEKFELPNKKPIDLKDLDKVTYTVRGEQILNNYFITERVRINTYHIDLCELDYSCDSNAPIIPVIIFQPSWFPDNTHPLLQSIIDTKDKTIATFESWGDTSATLYIVDDPRFLDLEPAIQELIILKASNLWIGKNGELYRFRKYNANAKEAKLKEKEAKLKNMGSNSGYQYGLLSGGSRRSRRRKTRRTRRTRRK